MKFIWDAQKAKSNFLKHKVQFTDAFYVFSDRFSLSLYDTKHSDSEERWITIGQGKSGKILVVVHTFRTIEEKEYIRIISVRKASKKEIKIYLERI